MKNEQQFLLLFISRLAQEGGQFFTVIVDCYYYWISLTNHNILPLPLVNQTSVQEAKQSKRMLTQRENNRREKKKSTIFPVHKLVISIDADCCECVAIDNLVAENTGSKTRTHKAFNGNDE